MREQRMLVFSAIRHPFSQLLQVMDDQRGPRISNDPFDLQSTICDLRGRIRLDLCGRF
jgi:hypothetical protein